MARTASIVAAYPISTTQIQAVLSVTDENSRIYAIAQPTGTTAPSAAEVIAGLDGDGGATAVAANTIGLVPSGAVAGLTFPEAPSGATYDVYAVATDADGANAGVVDGPEVVTLAAEFVVAPYPTAPDFPANPNPGAPNGVPSTLPDAIDATVNPWVAIISKLSATNDPTGPGATVDTTVVGAGTTVYTGLYPVGVPAPTAAELKAGTGAVDAATTPLTGGVEANIPLTPVNDSSFYLFATYERGGTSDSDVYFVGEFSTVNPGTDAPYVGFGPGVAVSPVMPTGIENWQDGNRVIAVIPQTVIISAN